MGETCVVTVAGEELQLNINGVPHSDNKMVAYFSKT
jgi:hypothetical protein